MYSLQLFGGVFLKCEQGLIEGSAAQRHRLALLALLAAHHDGLSRDKLVAYLWPERDSKHARNLLKQAVHALRRALGVDSILTIGDDLRLNASVVQTDVVEFEDAVSREDGARAVEIYRGEFLDGFFLRDAPEFEHWVDRERTRLADTWARALEKLAEQTEASGDHRGAVPLWKARAARDPYDSRVAIRLVLALDAGGNRAAALHHAQVHERLLRDEFGMEPPRELKALAGRLRREPAPTSDLPAQPPSAGDTATAGNTSAPAPTGTPVDEMPAPTRMPTQRREKFALRYAVGTASLVAAVSATAWVMLRARHQPASSSAAAAAKHAGPDRATSSMTTVRAAGRRQATRNLAAYELYVHGSDRSLFRSDSGVRAGLQLLRQAVALDSSYAAAWAALGLTYGRLALSGSITTGDRERYYALATQASRTALSLDDSLAEAHATFGIMRMISFDFALGERELLRAIELDPRSAMMHEKLVPLYLWTGRPDDALSHARHAVELEPLSPTAHGELAQALLGNDRCDDALAELDKISRMRPALLRTASLAAQCYAREKRWREAIAVLHDQARTNEPTALAQLAYMYVHSGRRADALRIRDDLLERWQRGEIGAYALALVDAGLGRLDQAVVWLDRSISDRSLSGGGGNPAQVMLMGPLFEELRRQPGFKRLRPELGLPGE